LTHLEERIGLTDQEQLHSTKTLVSDLTKQLHTARARVNRLEQAAASGTHQTEQLRAELSEVNAQREALLTELKRVQTGCDSHVARLQKELKTKDSVITQLRTELSDATTRIPSLKEEVRESEREAKALQERLSELQAQKARLANTLDQMKTAYDTMLSELQKELENKEVTLTHLENRLSVTFVDRVLFDFAKADITPRGKQVLGKVGKEIRNISNQKIRAVGHTDDIPIHPGYRYKFPSNWELSAARAAAVVRLFQRDCGINPEKMEAVGRSFHEPVASNETAEGRALNRRVEIIITPELN